MSSEINITEHIKLAEEGNSESQNILGDYYYDKKSPEHDFEKAFKWYKKAAEAGDVDAQYSLAFCYKEGIGVEKDAYKAFEWFKKSADAGNKSALYPTGALYYEGEGVDQDLLKAVEYFKKAADHGDTDAQNHLGICYKNGYGVSQNLAKAIECFKKSADAGDSNAQFNLARHYLLGDGVEENIAECFRLLNPSANMGHDMALMLLGTFYLEGKCVVAQDLAKAIELFYKAAERGNLHAIRLLTRVHRQAKSVAFENLSIKQTESILERFKEHKVGGKRKIAKNLEKLSQMYNNGEFNDIIKQADDSLRDAVIFSVQANNINLIGGDQYNIHLAQ